MGVHYFLMSHRNINICSDQHYSHFYFYDCAVVDEAIMLPICMCFLQLSWPPYLWHIVPVENLTPSGAVGFFFLSRWRNMFMSTALGSSTMIYR